MLSSAAQDIDFGLGDYRGIYVFWVLPMRAELLWFGSEDL